MRLRLLGLGRIGIMHAEILAGLPAVEDLVISDPVPGLAEEAAGRLGAQTRVQAAESPEALLAAGVDGIVIAASTGFHASLIELGVAAGLPTFCEKPVSGDNAEAARLARQVTSTGVPVQIGYPRRGNLAGPGFSWRAARGNGSLVR
jgi:myo-inositol 2-dehydrogenase / D-chiro-inositol 1-dehydrogenase